MMRLESIAVLEDTEVTEDIEDQATETLRHRENPGSLLRQRENRRSVSLCLRGCCSPCPPQTLCAHPTSSRKLRRIRSPTSPDFSGWNCTPATCPRCTIAANRPPCSVTATVSPLSGAA